LVTQAAAQRFEGYKAALRKKKIPLKEDYVVKTDYSRGQARQAAEKLLKLEHPPTAIFVASDSMALEVVSVALEFGNRIPQDLSIVGFDDNPMGRISKITVLRRESIHNLLYIDGK